MLSTSGDLLATVLVAMFTAAIAVAVSHLVSWRRSRIPRLRLLTGTRSQQAAIVLAVRPVVRELLPGLEAVGLEVSSIALMPTLAGSAGEPLQAQVEQVHGTRAFIIRLAHMVGGILRRPEEVAGALADELLASTTMPPRSPSCGRRRPPSRQESWSPLVAIAVAIDHVQQAMEALELASLD